MSLDHANAVRRVALLREARGDAAGAIAMWREARDRYRAIEESAVTTLWRATNGTAVATWRRCSLRRKLVRFRS